MARSTAIAALHSGAASRRYAQMPAALPRLTLISCWDAEAEPCCLTASGISLECLRPWRKRPFCRVGAVTNNSPCGEPARFLTAPLRGSDAKSDAIGAARMGQRTPESLPLAPVDESRRTSSC